MRQTLANQLALIIAVIIVFLAVIFSWFQSTGIVGFVPGPPEEPAQLIPHAVFGYQKCRNCHSLDAQVPFPPDHVSYSDSVCTGCHIPSGEKIPPHELNISSIYALAGE
jgi:hypothetical protein